MLNIKYKDLLSGPIWSLAGAIMAEMRKIDEDIDQTLLLFQNAIAEAVVPPSPSDRSVEAKDPPLSEPAAKRPASLIGDFVAFARTVSGFDSAAPRAMPRLLDPPVAKSAWEAPVENGRIDPFDNWVPAQPLRIDTTEATASLRQPPDKSAAKGTLHPERPTQEMPHAPIGDVHFPRIAEHATESPAGGERFDLLLDQPPSALAVAGVDEPDMAGDVPQALLGPAETAAVSPQQPADEPALRSAFPLEPAIQQEPSVPIDFAHSARDASGDAEELVSEERPVPLTDPSLSITATDHAGEREIAKATQRPALDLGEGTTISIWQPIVAQASLALEQPLPGQPAAPIENAHSLAIKKVVISVQKAVQVKQLLISEPEISEPEAVQVADLSLQSCAEPAPEKPASDARSGALVDQVLTLIAEDVPSARPVREELPFLLEQALSLVRDVVLSDGNTIPSKEIASSEFNEVEAAPPSFQPLVDKPALEEPDRPPQLEALVVEALVVEALVDHAPSAAAVVTIGEPSIIEEAPPLLLRAAEPEPASIQQQNGRPAPEGVLPSSELIREEPPSSVDRTDLARVETAPAASRVEAKPSPPPQPFVAPLSPEERLDLELADIRKRVAAFKANQQRFQREREEMLRGNNGKGPGQPG